MGKHSSSDPYRDLPVDPNWKPKGAKESTREAYEVLREADRRMAERGYRQRWGDKSR